MNPTRTMQSTRYVLISCIALFFMLVVSMNHSEVIVVEHDASIDFVDMASIRPVLNKENNGLVHKYRFVDVSSGNDISFSKAMDLLHGEDDGFRNQVTQAIVSSGFRGLFWECAPVSTLTSDKPFEFIVARSPELSSIQQGDKSTFRRYFNTCGDPLVKEEVGGDGGSGDINGRSQQLKSVISFSNLGGDAQLVVPCPSVDSDLDYMHLSAFLRAAPSEQIHQLWKMVGSKGREKLNTLREANSPAKYWLSTSGLGVYWLHIRFDSSPKYYTYAQYKHDK